MVSDLTYKIAVFSQIENFNMDESVDWAIEMLRLGFDSPSLLILSGLTKPVNYFEGEEYLKATLKELNIEERSGDDAVLFYSYYLVKKIEVLDNIRENLRALCELSISTDFPRYLHDFYLLHCAWGDLEWGNEIHDYWQGATKDNIQRIVVDKAKEWLKYVNLNVFA